MKIFTVWVIGFAIGFTLGALTLKTESEVRGKIKESEFIKSINQDINFRYLDRVEVSKNA